MLKAEVLAQVNFPYAFIINDFLGFSAGQNGPVVDNIGAVADAQCLSDTVVGDQDPDLTIFKKTNDFLDIEHSDRIDSGKGFVQEDKLRVGR